jgi:type II secretory pathway predicted ATPase ExeA
MYETYWELDAKPFEHASDVRFYYPGEAHQAALLKLRYAVESQRGAALLTGGAGLGKSLLVQTLARQLDERYAPFVRLVFPQMPPDQLLAYLAGRLTSHRADHLPIAESLRLIEDALRENVKAGRRAVIVIDEAQHLCESGTLETVRLLLNLETPGGPGFTLLLVGQPLLLPTLDRLPMLDERLGVKCLIRPFRRDESESYVQHRLQAAGAARPIFDDAALAAIHRLAHGSPRRINRLCDLALLIGYAEERSVIGEAQIVAVSEELTSVAPE